MHINRCIYVIIVVYNNSLNIFIHIYVYIYDCLFSFFTKHLSKFHFMVHTHLITCLKSHQIDVFQSKIDNSLFYILLLLLLAMVLPWWDDFCCYCFHSWSLYHEPVILLSRSDIYVRWIKLVLVPVFRCELSQCSIWR